MLNTLLKEYTTGGESVVVNSSFVPQDLWVWVSVLFDSMAGSHNYRRDVMKWNQVS